MGKVADNEWAKLTASYYSNLAVAVLVTGGLAPYLLMYTGSITTGESTLFDFVIWVLVYAFVLLCATLLRRCGKNALNDIKD